MSYLYTIKVAHQRGDKKYWSPIGTLFYNPANDEFGETIALRLNSAPPIECECRAFPRDDDQQPADCTERFNLTVKIEREGMDRPYYHSVETAFYSPPNGKYAENFNLKFDSYPFDGTVTGYPPRERAAEDTAA